MTIVETRVMKNRYASAQDVRSVAVIGTGAVGASWIALFLAHGLEVVAFDPAVDAEERTRKMVAAAWPTLSVRGEKVRFGVPVDSLRFARSAAEASRQADVVQENIPERAELKARVLAEIDAAAAPEKIILSSTGGLSPSEMQRACRHPERLVVLHPFNPAHLIRLVEVVGGRETAPEVLDWAEAFARRMGKVPIRLNTEIPGHLTNRLQFALLREAMSCLLAGVASAKDIDTAIRHGLAPRWALMGGLLTFHLAGGDGGTRGILEHAGDAIETWWNPSAMPPLTPDVVDRLSMAGDEVSGGLSASDWSVWRDAGLVEILTVQRRTEALAAGVLASDESKS
jgi:carnitine 3-dehydrogenase